MAVTGSRPTELRAVLASAARKAVTAECILVSNEAKRLARVDTGTLRRSITFSVTGSSAETISGRVGSNLNYALMVEVGTGIYGPRGRRITPKRAKVLAWQGKGGPVFAASTRGRKATPFLRPALRAMRTFG